MHPLFKRVARVMARTTPVAVVALAALALGLGTASAAEVSVTRQQADDAARAAAAAEEPLVRIVETVVWSEPPVADALAESPAWFPTLDEDALALPAAPAAVTSFGVDAFDGGDVDAGLNPIAREHTVIPLPPAAMTGLVGLASLATIRGRKAIAKFFT